MNSDRRMLRHSSDGKCQPTLPHTSVFPNSSLRVVGPPPITPRPALMPLAPATSKCVYECAAAGQHPHVLTKRRFVSEPGATLHRMRRGRRRSILPCEQRQALPKHWRWRVVVSCSAKLCPVPRLGPARCARTNGRLLQHTLTIRWPFVVWRWAWHCNRQAPFQCGGRRRKPWKRCSSTLPLMSGRTESFCWRSTSTDASPTPA